MNITTVTLNPSFDVSLWVDSLEDGCVNKVLREGVAAGGKGVNVSKALLGLGVQSVVTGLAGRQNLPQFQSLLETDGLTGRFVETDGAIRENLTLFCGTQEYKLNRPGSPCAAIHLEQLADLLETASFNGDCFVFGGSFPPGDLEDAFLSLCRALTCKGVRLCIDSVHVSLAALKKIKPFLIKPNEQELERLVGRRLLDPDDINREARRICEDGTQLVLVSRGQHGAMLVTPEHAWLAEVPSVPVQTAVGAGDSTLAGFLYALSHGNAHAESLRFAAACGTCSVRDGGPGRISKGSADILYDQITVREI